MVEPEVEQRETTMGSDKDKGQAGTAKARITGSQNIKPGIIIVFNADGRVVYDGPGNLMPEELLAAAASALMHTHDKMVMDAKLKNKSKVHVFGKN